MLQELAWQVSLILVSLLIAVYLFVAWRARAQADFAPIQRRGYRLRAMLFWALLLLATPVVIYSTTDLPYAATRGRGDKVDIIEAVAHQWRWQLSANTAVVGRPVEFRVASADVNHGFGLYDPQMRLVAQTMAMPGYVNRLRHTFTRPGTYQVLCLEYCGLMHHAMIARIEVSDAPNVREAQ